MDEGGCPWRTKEGWTQTHASRRKEARWRCLLAKGRRWPPGRTWVGRGWEGFSPHSLAVGGQPCCGCLSDFWRPGLGESNFLLFYAPRLCCSVPAAPKLHDPPAPHKHSQAGPSAGPLLTTRFPFLLCFSPGRAWACIPSFLETKALEPPPAFRTPLGLTPASRVPQFSTSCCPSCP